MPSRPWSEIKRKRAGRPAAGETGAKVRHVARPGRWVLNVRPEDRGVWECPELPIGLGPAGKGALVKLHPPADATDERIEEVAAAFKAAGAAAVQKAPRAPKAKTVPTKVQTTKAATHRQVVAELVAEARFPDKRALQEACEQLMDEESL